MLGVHSNSLKEIVCNPSIIVEIFPNLQSRGFSLFLEGVFT